MMTHSNSSLQKSVSNKLNWWQICKPAFSALVQIGLVIAVLGWILSSGADAMNYRWQWHQIPQYLFVHEDGEWYRGELIDGLLITLKISAVSLIFTLGLGLITALLRLSDSIVGRALARGYIELIRNTPLLVQIYILYFVLGPILDLERFTTAVLALSLFQGAYTAEIFRAGLNAIPKGQFEAAASLGLSQWQMYKRILPPLTNETVSLVKNSSIVSIMAIFDLTTVRPFIYALLYCCLLLRHGWHTDLTPLSQNRCDIQK